MMQSRLVLLNPLSLFRVGVVGAAVALSACSTSRPFYEKDLLASYAREVEPVARDLAAPRAAQEDGPAPAAPTAGGEPSIGEDSTLEECVTYALLHNPEAQAAYYRWQAEIERIDQATALPDPMLMIGRGLRRAEARYAVGVSQMVPAWGKRELRGREASKMADAGRKRFEAAALAVRYNVASAYYELQYVAQAVALTNENLKLLRSLEEVAAVQYQVAAGSQADLVRLQIESAELEDRLAQLADLRVSLAARFNAALNRPHDAPVPFGRPIDPMSVGVGADGLLALLREANPELHGMDDEVEAARIGTELARRERLPDVTFSLEYEDMREPMDDLSDPLMLGVSVNLPIWREKNEAQLGESIARRLAVSAERRARYNMLSAELGEAHFEHRDANRRLALYRDSLIPKADQSLASLLGLYQAGRGGFLDVLDAERMLLEFQLAQRRAAADSAVALARLDAIIGRPVPAEPESALPSPESEPEMNP